MGHKTHILISILADDNAADLQSYQVRRVLWESSMTDRFSNLHLVEMNVNKTAFSVGKLKYLRAKYKYVF